MKRSLLCILVTAIPAAAQDIQPADCRGIRTISGQGPLLLTFLAVKKTSTPLDDRTVMEFALSQTWLPTFGGAKLLLGLSDLDPGAPAGTIDVFVYQGDGVVTEQEFFAGVFRTSFQFDGVGVAEVDVSNPVAEALLAGHPFIGFRLSTVTADRYFLGSIVGQPEPLMRIETSCYPDCNHDGVLNLSDFGCFQTAFATAAAYADCNGDGVRNLSDFGCFQTKFALGCP